MAREYLPGGHVTDDNTIAQVVTTTAHSALSGLSADDHTQYQKESEKGAANGYAPLNGSTKIANSYLLTGTGNGLDADTVDGSHAAAFALSGHTHAGIPSIALKTSDQSGLTDDSYVNVTSTGVSISASETWAFEFVLICDADATTTGIDVACNGPGTVNYEQVYWTSTTAFSTVAAVAYDNDTASASSNGTSPRLFRVRGIVRTSVGQSGTLIARIKRESGVGDVSVRAGSYCIAHKLSS